MKDEVKAKLAAASDRCLSFLTHDLPGSFALSGCPVYLADFQSARFSSDLHAAH